MDGKMSEININLSEELGRVIHDKSSTKANIIEAADQLLRLLYDTRAIIEREEWETIETDPEPGITLPEPQAEGCPTYLECVDLLKCVWKKERSNTIRNAAKKYPKLVHR